MNRQATFSPARKALSMLLALALSLGMLGAALASPAALTLEDALQIALESADAAEADVLVTKLALDTDDGREAFEVEFLHGDSEYEFDIDAASGSIIKSSTERIDRDMQALDTARLLGMEEATRIALEHAGIDAQAATITGFSLDADDGRVEYEVTFRAGNSRYEIELDAYSGEILQTEIKS